jgi:cobalt-zinc-cadmium efflux system protein
VLLMPNDLDHDHSGHSHAAHSHGVSADADRGKLTITLGLILGFMAFEVTVGVIAHSLALLSDAAHMLTDAGAIGLSLVALRLAARPAKGAMTYGLKRMEILSAQFNGATLLVLALLIIYEGVRRLVTPPPVAGTAVLVVALVGIVVNLAATYTLSKANRQSLNVEGSFKHIVTDLAAFIFAAIAGAVILATGFRRADGIASLLIAAIMLVAVYGLLKASGRVFLEAAPQGLNPHRSADGGRGRCFRGPRPTRVGGHLRVPGTLRARARRRAKRLPPNQPCTQAPTARRLRYRPHHPANRPRAQLTGQHRDHRTAPTVGKPPPATVAVPDDEHPSWNSDQPDAVGPRAAARVRDARLERRRCDRARYRRDRRGVGRARRIRHGLADRNRRLRRRRLATQGRGGL